MYISKNFENLVSELSKLPGIGMKSAGRFAYHIINAPEKDVDRLVESIKSAKTKIKKCKICNAMTDEDICNICQNEKRDKNTIMVVENDRDLVAYEKVGEYKGVYHVLGGAISPLLGIGPDELKIKELIKRLSGDVKEIIIATNSSVEGETTASYLIKLIKPFNIKISRIASGVPVGGDIENIDSITLSRALDGRKEV